MQGLEQLPRTPLRRSSQNTPSTHFGALGQEVWPRLLRSGPCAATAETQAHRSDGQCQRSRLRHPLYPTTTSSTPMPRRRLWDRVYCLRTADKSFDTNIVCFSFSQDLQENQRVDERTRTAYPCSLRVRCSPSGCDRTPQ